MTSDLGFGLGLASPVLVLWHIGPRPARFGLGLEIAGLINITGRWLKALKSVKYFYTPYSGLKKILL